MAHLMRESRYLSIFKLVNTLSQWVNIWVNMMSFFYIKLILFININIMKLCCNSIIISINMIYMLKVSFTINTKLCMHTYISHLVLFIITTLVTQRFLNREGGRFNYSLDIHQLFIFLNYFLLSNVETT